MTSHYTPDELIAAAKAYIAADAEIMARRPANCPRAAWRIENPIDLQVRFAVRDLALKTRPVRSLSFDLNGNPYDLWVWSRGRKPAVLARIDLNATDAAIQLQRFERV